MSYRAAVEWVSAASFRHKLEVAENTIGEILKQTRFLKVEDFHDLSYIRERLQILLKEQDRLERATQERK
jgi:hypothetical protein